MNSPIRTICVALVAVASTLMIGTQPADAFWHHRRVTTAYAMPTVPVTVGYAPVVAAPVVAARPVVVASPVVTAAYAPAPVTTYYAPAPVTTTYYAPAPVTTYYAPAPVTTYYAPAAAGVIVQRPVIVWP
jgi:hypothetical protein